MLNRHIGATAVGTQQELIVQYSELVVYFKQRAVLTFTYCTYGVEVN